MEQFDAKQQLPGLLDWMRAQMKACGGKTAVIGISGGKDSSVVAALSVAAYGRENVVGVLMPDGVQPDIDYSNGLVEYLGIRLKPSGSNPCSLHLIRLLIIRTGSTVS